jgi:hypothetical protein
MKAGPGCHRNFVLLDFTLIFLLTAALIWPLFKVKYTDKWASIEATFIADARFLKQHWPHPQWQPLWYGGTRFDYIYPPALRYGTAALARFYPMTEARAYHLYTAFFYCIGIAGVYLFVRVTCGSRGASWLAAAGAALLSPSFLFLSTVRGDAWLRHPVRLGALVRYGEGPHMTAFALLPIALVASFLAIRQWRPLMMAAAAASCALLVSNNFYGATALAISFPILVWSLWITHQDNRIWLRALLIPPLAYGLTASWLVPSYFRVTMANMKLVSEPGNTWSIWLTLAVVAVYTFATARWARGRQGAFHVVFVTGFALFFTLNVLGNQYFGFRVAGEPGRMVPELDLALILLAAVILRRLWNRGTSLSRGATAAFLLVAFATAIPYARRAWKLIVPDHNWEDRIEYKLTSWIATNLPGARTMATGSVRFWYDAWYDLPQVGGGSEQGTLNQIVNVAYSQITNDPGVESSVHWMHAFALDAIIVHDEKSREIYHDYVNPRKFTGALPVLFDNHQGDVIYRVPRRYPDLAHVVETARVGGLPTIGPIADIDVLRTYAEALEKGPESRAVTAWQGLDRMRIQATTMAGQSLIVQVAYDPQWRARSAGASFAIRKDALGQMLIETPPGRHDIELWFETPLENQVGKVIAMLTALIVIGLAGLGWRR